MEDPESKGAVEVSRTSSTTTGHSGSWKDDTSAKGGEAVVAPLDMAEITQLLVKYGDNTIQTAKKRKCYHVFLGALLHPFNILLTVLAIASSIAEEVETLGIMMVMVLLSAVLRFYQEWKSEVAVKSLLKYVATKVIVLRRNAYGQVTEVRVASTEVVPGDWIKLYPGELVPADAQVLVSKDFHVSQSALTGESIPVEKHNLGNRGDRSSRTSSLKLSNNAASFSNRNKEPVCARIVNFLRQVVGLQVYKPISVHPEDGPDENDLDKPNLVFQGSSVVTGTATCLVLSTGSNTHFGRLASELARRKPQNAFQLGVRRISFIFFITMMCMIPPVMLLQALLVNDENDYGDDVRCTNKWCKATFFALSVAVGLTPEMLPMIVTTALAKGAVDLSRRNCIVKQLDAIINMGGIDVLCTDKTGTLTLSTVTLHRYLNRFGAKSQIPLFLGYVNSYFQSVRQNPLDSAIISYFGKHDFPDIIAAIDKFNLIDQVSFDFVRRRMSVILEGKGEFEASHRLLVCKGAVEEVLQKCTSCMALRREEDISGIYAAIRDGVGMEHMTDVLMGELQDFTEELNANGLRVIAIAFKKVPIPARNLQMHYTTADESKLTFVGLLTFLDPPKETSREAIHYLASHNVAVKVLTGDSHLVCKKVCKDIGIPTDKIVTGKELAKIMMEEDGQEKLLKIVEETTIFAKLTPVQKSEVVRALKMNGHIVGFLGDGINDAPLSPKRMLGSVWTVVQIFARRRQTSFCWRRKSLSLSKGS